uniref:Coatomer subunit zeta n=1 Tax=Astatotilapia calliptera TaxID=8154 RepID=A0AAX7TB29_ASTCA
LELAEPSLYTVKAVFILDNDGNRLLSKYYDPELYPSMKEQKTFERNVFNKTHKADSKFHSLLFYVDLFWCVMHAPPPPPVAPSLCIVLNVHRRLQCPDCYTLSCHL